jgi:hypothetical protein
MTAVLDPRATRKLTKIAGMFGSAHDGERAAAAALADRLVRELGLQWADIISVPLVPADPIGTDDIDWQQALKICLGNIDELDQRSRAFIQSLSRWRGQPSQKQVDWLRDIYARVAGGGR